MRKGRLLYRVREAINDMCFIFVKELKSVFHDQGVLIFFILVPLGYPLLYSWIYTNEVVKDVPTAFVDQSHSHLSREFIRKCDATDGIKVAALATSVAEAREMQARQLCHGIVYIPADFETKVDRGEQTAVSFFADLSGVLYYKAIFGALTDVTLDMGKEIQIARLGNYTNRDDEVSTKPLKYEAVSLFNPAGGYGSFLLPAVLVLILQQTLLLGIGMSAGTARESNRYQELVPVRRHYSGTFRIVFGKALCYFSIYVVMALYILVAVPRIFDFPHLAEARELTALIVPFLLACIFFGITISALVRYRENVILLVLFTSVPFLFLSGVSWPESGLSGQWKALSYLIPSSFGIEGFVKINNFGASLEDIRFEYQCLWIQTLVYFFTACVCYWYQIQLSRTHSINRLHIMRLRKIAKRELKSLDVKAETDNE